MLTRSHVNMDAQANIHRMLSCGDKDYARISTELLRARFVDLVAAVKPQMSLEVGAHHAHYSRLVAQRFKQMGQPLDVIAIEANPSVYERYKDLVEGAGVDFRNMAVAEYSGELSFKVPINRDGSESSHMGSILDLSGSADTRSYSVPCVRMAELGRRKPFVLWADVEGANRQVFSGCDDMLTHCQAAFVEVEEHELWKGQMLAEEFISFCEDRGLVAVLRDYQRFWQYNMLLVRRDQQNVGWVEDCINGYFSDIKALAAKLPFAAA